MKLGHDQCGCIDGQCFIGIRRPPALLATGHAESLADINCSKYEISYCEPLHDLRNTIQFILEELADSLKELGLDEKLTKQVADFCVQAKGEPTISVKAIIIQDVAYLLS